MSDIDMLPAYYEALASEIDGTMTKMMDRMWQLQIEACIVSASTDPPPQIRAQEVAQARGQLAPQPVCMMCREPSDTLATRVLRRGLVSWCDGCYVKNDDHWTNIDIWAPASGGPCRQKTERLPASAAMAWGFADDWDLLPDA